MMRPGFMSGVAAALSSGLLFAATSSTLHLPSSIASRAPVVLLRCRPNGGGGRRRRPALVLPPLLRLVLLAMPPARSGGVPAARALATLSSSPPSADDPAAKAATADAAAAAAAGACAAPPPALLAPSLRSVTPRLNLQIVDEADSTQDEARRLLEQAFGGGAAEEKADAAAADVKGGGSTGVPKNALIAVISRRQRRGRGTRGRTWESGAEHGEEDGGNLFLTVCLPLESVPVRITLLPLQVAVLVARLVDRYVAAAPSPPERQRRRRRTTVKWPNDVLVDDRKISGTLIESALVQDRGGASPSYSTSWLLIGIGINVNSAPDLAASASPGKHGRLATSLRDAIGAAAPLPSPAELGTELASQLADWVFQADQPDPPHSRESLENRVIEDWKDFAAFGTAYEMRGQTVEEEEAGDYEGERVTAQDIEPDGRLVVLDASGRERRLVADYLF